MDDQLIALLERLNLEPSGVLSPLSGGDIAEVASLETRQGTVVAKRDDPQRLAGEAEGLNALHMMPWRGVRCECPGCWARKGPGC